MDWIDDFYEITNHLPSPPIFRRWTGIAMLAGALERKVWIRAYRRQFFPNLFTILVATPGVGKSVLISLAYDYWDKLRDHHLAPKSLTKAALVDQLKDAQRNIIVPNGNPSVMSFNSLLAAVDEFGIFLPKYESDFMAVLNTMYDCYSYSERRRKDDKVVDIPKSQLNLLAGTQPSYLKDTLPEGAWDQGFASRIIFIYSGDMQLRDPLADEGSEHEEIDTELFNRLKELSAIHGKMKFTQEAHDSLKAWNEGGREPEPDHPKLYHYNTRRFSHVLKLAMLSSVSRGAFPRIELHDVDRGRSWLFEAEETMPDIFKAMKSGSDSRVMEDAWHYIFKTYTKGQKPVAEARLIGWLANETPVHNVARMLETMIRAQWIREVLEPGVGKVYIPLRKPSK